MIHKLAVEFLSSSTLLFLVACSGHDIVLGTGGTGSGGTAALADASSGGGAVAASSGNVSAGGDASLCDKSGGTEMTFQDEVEAQASLVGTWQLCSGPGLVFATEQADQAGVELTADMHWYALRVEGGGLSRAAGFQATGTYRFQPPQDLDYGPSQQAELFFGVDYSFGTLTMLDSPRKLRWQFDSPLSTAPSVYAYLAP